MCYAIYMYLYIGYSYFFLKYLILHIQKKKKIY